MKKALIVITLLLIPLYAWALPDRITPREYIGSQQITTKRTDVFAVSVSYAGVTAGDKIQLIDSTTSTTTPIVRTVVAPAANGSQMIAFTAADRFESGIYYKETKTGGTFTLDIQYF